MADAPPSDDFEAALNGYSDRARTVFAYWRRLGGTNGLPDWRDFDPIDVRAALPHCIVKAVSFKPLDFTYTLVGTAVRERLYQDYTGRRLTELDGCGPGSHIFEMHRRVVENRRPSTVDIPYVGPHKDFIRIRQMSLPFAAGTETVGRLLSLLDFVSATVE